MAQQRQHHEPVAALLDRYLKNTEIDPYVIELLEAKGVGAEAFADVNEESGRHYLTLAFNLDPPR